MEKELERERDAGQKERLEAECARRHSFSDGVVVATFRTLSPPSTTEKETHFRVGFVIVRARVGQSGHPGSAQGRRGEQGAANEGGKNHRESFFFLLLRRRRRRTRRRRKNERGSMGEKSQSPKLENFLFA